jgi:hypothetical protein
VAVKLQMRLENAHGYVRCAPLYHALKIRKFMNYKADHIFPAGLGAHGTSQIATNAAIYARETKNMCAKTRVPR